MGLCGWINEHVSEAHVSNPILQAGPWGFANNLHLKGTVHNISIERLLLKGRTHKNATWEMSLYETVIYSTVNNWMNKKRSVFTKSLLARLVWQLIGILTWYDERIEMTPFSICHNTIVPITHFFATVSNFSKMDEHMDLILLAPGMSEKHHVQPLHFLK